MSGIDGIENPSQSTTLRQQLPGGTDQLASPPFRIVDVHGRRMTTQFIQMARSVYRHDKHWIPPLTSAARKFMSPHRNPYFAEANADHFLALDADGHPIGRISASIDHRYVTTFSPTGFFGWFECINDQAIASALLRRAESWVADRGLRRIAGPYSYCSTQEFGLLTAGFDSTPAAFQAHNPPYYQNLIEGAGYHRAYGTDVYQWSAQTDAEVLRSIADRGCRAQEAFGLQVRHLDPRAWDTEMDLLYELFLASFSNNHDVVPISRPVFDDQVKELRAFFDPDLTFFVERDGLPVGFGLLIADANEVLAAADGRLTLDFLIRFKALRAAVTGAVVLMIGARPDAVGSGVGRVLAGVVARIALGEVGSYARVHTTWIHQDNWQSRALVAGTGAQPRRSYAIFERELGR